MNYWQDDDVAKCAARRGSKADLNADVTSTHPTRPDFVICWKFLKAGLKILACLILCPGTWLIALKMVASRGTV